MTNEVQDGKKITWTNGTGSNVVAGQVVAVGILVGVACVAIANGASGAVAMDGVFTVPKATGNAWVSGAKVLWDVSAAKFDHGGATPATGDISGCCVAWAGAASGDTTGKVKINVGVGTVA